MMVSIKARQLSWLFISFLLFTASPAGGAENMRVAHPSLSSSVICLLIANKEGYFKEEGINVEFLSIRGEIAIRTALAGEVDFFTNAGSAMAAAARNVPVKILAVFQDRPGWDLIAQPNIKSIAQLRGSTIAIMSPEGSLAVVTREILKKNGMDPAKDANLVVMGGDDVRLPAMKAKAIQASLFNAAASVRAQKDGFVKLASASEYATTLQGGLATTEEKIRQHPARMAKFIRGSLKGLQFFINKRDASVKHMMEFLKTNDHEMASAIYDIEAKLIVRDGTSEDRVLQPMIDEMKRATKTQRDMKVNDVFDFSMVRKANEELKMSGWRP
jgi:ABC-type nitrate/sulfonate/bicarbonate transport system substrate-binding protein